MKSVFFFIEIDGKWHVRKLFYVIGLITVADKIRLNQDRMIYLFRKNLFDVDERQFLSHLIIRKQ